MAWARAGLLQAACTANKTSVAASTTLDKVLPPVIALHVQDQISETLGVPAQNLQITKAEGVAAGWLLTFNSQGQAYRYRIDETGTVVRQEP